MERDAPQPPPAAQREGHDHHGRGGHHADDTRHRRSLRHVRPSTVLSALRHLWSSEVNTAAIDLLAPHEGDHVLELGAGFGPATGGMVERVGPTGRVVTIDPSRSMRLVQRFRRRWMRHRHVVEITNGAGEALPVPDRSVDRLLGLNVMHHLDDLERTAGEAARALKPEARLVLIDEDFGHPAHSFATAADGDHPPPDLSGTDTLAGLLTRHGFADVETSSTPVGGEPALVITATR